MPCFILMFLAVLALPGVSAISVEVDAAATKSVIRKHGEQPDSHGNGSSQPAPFPTTQFTCDGTSLTESQCSGNDDPCAASSELACIGTYHNCGSESFKQCHLNSGVCGTGPTCFLKCPGTYVGTLEIDGMTINSPDCSQLKGDKCQEHYVNHQTEGLGMRCRLKDQNLCISDVACAIQDPPDTMNPHEGAAAAAAN